MSKRKRSSKESPDDLLSTRPKRSRINTVTNLDPKDVNIEFLEFVRQLKGKFTPSVDNKLWLNLNTPYNILELEKQQITKFILEQLSKDERFNGISLREKPDRNSSGSYNFQDRNFSVTVNNQQSASYNPVLSFIHEGTHALDDLSMRTYQRNALTWLSKNVPEQKINSDKPGRGKSANWYKQAQEILGNKSFEKVYKFSGNGETSASIDIKRGFSQLLNGRSEDPEALDENLTYSKAYEEIKDKILTDNQSAYPENNDFAILSEFAAHFVEQLGTSIPEERVTYQRNLGRKFIKSIAKGVQNNFMELDPEFAGNYPDAHKAFNDRIFELANKVKLSQQVPPIQNAEQYFEYRQKRRIQQKLEPGNITPAGAHTVPVDTSGNITSPEYNSRAIGDNTHYRNILHSVQRVSVNQSHESAEDKANSSHEGPAGGAP